MMNSMTGFGKGVCKESGLEIGVELKSVNNRFLDVTVKCPHILAQYEELIRSMLREKFTRGHVDVFVSLADKRERPKKFYVDFGTVDAYLHAASEIKGKFSVPNDMSLSFLMKLPDVIRTEEAEADEDMLNGLKTALNEAICALSDMRAKEGERLKADLLSRMEEIERLCGEIALRAPRVAEEYRKKLTDRINEYLGGKVEESRILTEAAVFADKCDIDEELTRLSSHIVQFRKICEEPAAGRKLDFLVQEFNRECNTVCSKSNDAVLTASALRMKNEIEKVREQIQNLE